MTSPILFCTELAVVVGCGYAPDGGRMSDIQIPESRTELHGSAYKVAPNGGTVDAPLFSANRAVLPGTPCKAAPENAEFLDTLDNLALHSGETIDDVASNNMRHNGDCPSHNSLFLRRCRADGTVEWRVLLTTGSNWREGTGMVEWSSFQSTSLKEDFYIMAAKFGLDRRRLWLVCNTDNLWWNVVCSYDVQSDDFRALIDGDTADEQLDGTILVKGKKVYLPDENGEPLGARWCDVWINPNGDIVRKAD